MLSGAVEGEIANSVAKQAGLWLSRDIQKLKETGIIDHSFNPRHFEYVPENEREARAEQMIQEHNAVIKTMLPYNDEKSWNAFVEESNEIEKEFNAKMTKRFGKFGPTRNINIMKLDKRLSTQQRRSIRREEKIINKRKEENPEIWGIK